MAIEWNGRDEVGGGGVGNSKYPPYFSLETFKMFDKHCPETVVIFICFF